MAGPHPHKRVARTAAISILSVVGAVLAVWAAPRVSDAAAAWMSTPPVRTATTSLTSSLPVAPALARAGAAQSKMAAASGGGTAASASQVIDSGMRFTMAGVTCRPPAVSGAVDVLLRTSQDGATWSRWYTVSLERVAEEGGKQQAFTEPIWTGTGRYLQVAARGASAGRSVPTSLRGVHVVAINSTEDADRGAVVIGALRRAAAAVAGLQLVPPVGAMTTKPKIVTRSEWGANESWRSGSPSFAPVKMAFIHHTDSGNVYSQSEAPAIVRGVYAYHTKSLHWSDVGYNFLIDRYGTIYEGRYGGMTKGVLGAQVLGFNTGSTGISVIGTFTNATPPSAAVTSLERLLEWKLDIHHVDPRGTGTLVCGYGQKYKTGQSVKFPAIAGHRDANYTDCPGGRLYTLLPDARKVVAREGQPKIYGFVVGDPAISPNGDDVSESTTIGFTVSETASWRIEIRDATGRLVRHLAGEGTVVSTTWSGRDDEGKLLEDGEYALQADATSASGEARSATATLLIDTTAPKVSSAEVSPDPFSPNGDGQNDVATLAFLPTESGSARVSVVEADGTVLRRLTGWNAVTAADQSAKWDGRIASGSGLAAAPEGAAMLELEVRDAAGNSTSLRRKVTVDRTMALTAPARKAFSPNGDGVYDSIVLAFKLTRTADVTGTVIHAGETVRTIRLGKVAAGSRTVTWDGAVSGGKVTNGAYVFKLTAEGEIGTSSVEQALTVDLNAPKIVAPASAKAAYRKTAKVAYTVRDQFSPVVKVIAVVTDAKGRTVTTIACGWVKQGATHICSWKPRAKGSYKLSFRAQDQSGNRQVAIVATSLRVR
jgi:flagellar hook assembly protein FlgD